MVRPIARAGPAIRCRRRLGRLAGETPALTSPLWSAAEVPAGENIVGGTATGTDGTAEPVGGASGSPAGGTAGAPRRPWWRAGSGWPGRPHRRLRRLRRRLRYGRRPRPDGPLGHLRGRRKRAVRIRRERQRRQRDGGRGAGVRRRHHPAASRHLRGRRRPGHSRFPEVRKAPTGSEPGEPGSASGPAGAADSATTAVPAGPAGSPILGTPSTARRAELAERLHRVRERIATACAAAGRDPAEITLVAITKTRPAADVRLLYELGQRDFGENRDQEAAPKAAQCADLPVTWHFVGQLQTNKAASVARYADVIHSVDRLRLIRALGNAARRQERSLTCLVQVSLEGPTADASRGGAPTAQVPAFADASRGGAPPAQVSAPRRRDRGRSGPHPRRGDGGRAAGRAGCGGVRQARPRGRCCPRGAAYGDDHFRRHER